MQDTVLFQLALALPPPWFVRTCKLEVSNKRLTIYLDFARGGRFPCPECGQADCPVYDTTDHQWRHLDFFQYETYLEVRTPRIKCDRCGVKVVRVPWARPDSGFTLLFERLIMTLVQQMPVKAVARIVNEHDTRLWRVLGHYIEVAREQLDLSSVVALGMDEKSIRRGHNYVTLFVDLDRSQVIYATEGRDAGTVAEFRAELFRRGVDGGAIQDIACDMSPAYIKGIETDFAWAQVTFDKFHVMKLINEAVDKVRREEQRERPELKKSRFAWLTRGDHQTSTQAKLIEALSLKRLNLKTARAYQLSLTFQDFWHQSAETAEDFLKRWYWWASHSRLDPMRVVAGTIKRHWRGILNWFRSRISNAVLEGINSMVQAAKARARGYRTTKNFINMIYLIAGKLNFVLPT